mgnify:CR=1 FL=1
MKLELTDRRLRALKPNPSKRLELSDTKRLGLRFRLSQSGKASWAYEKRIKNGKKRKFTIGSWPTITLAAARKIALEIEVEAMQGIDRVDISNQQKAENESRHANRQTIRSALSEYDELHLQFLKTGAERFRQLTRALSSKLDLPINTLKTPDLQEPIDKFTKDRKIPSANRVRAALRAFTNWSWQRGYLNTDIGLRVGGAKKENPRERVLSVLEVRQIYDACESLGVLWGSLFRLILLTGQRRSEITSLRWQEVEFENRRIVKPGATTKNGKPHITHLSGASLDQLIRIEEPKTEFVFSTTGSTPVSGISKVKDRLDIALGPDFNSWRIHDIRTAMATALAESGEAEGVVDRILNHSASGSSPSAVARVYQQSDLLVQRAIALDTWANMIARK